MEEESNFLMGGKKSCSYQILLVLDHLQVGTYNWHVGCLFVFQVEQRVLKLIKS